MIYEFEDIVIDGWELAIEGKAEFSGNPRDCDPDITIDGYDWRTRVSSDTPMTAACSPTLHAHILADLKGRQWKAIMSQWADEAHDRRDAARGDAERFRLDSYSV